MRNPSLLINVARLVVLTGAIGCVSEAQPGTLTLVRLEDPKKADDPAPVQACLNNANNASCENQPVTLTEPKMPVCEAPLTIAYRKLTEAPEASGITAYWSSGAGLVASTRGSVLIGNFDYITNDTQKRVALLYEDIIDTDYNPRTVTPVEVEFPIEKKIVDAEGLQVVDYGALPQDFPGRSAGCTHTIFVPDVSHGGRGSYNMWALCMRAPLSQNKPTLIGGFQLVFSDSRDHQGVTYTKEQLTQAVWHATVDEVTHNLILISQALDPDSSIQKSLGPTLRFIIPYTVWGPALAASTGILAPNGDGTLPIVGVPTTALRIFLEVATALMVRQEATPAQKAEFLTVVPEKFRERAKRVLNDANIIDGDADKTLQQVLDEAQADKGDKSVSDYLKDLAGPGKYGSWSEVAKHPIGRMVVTGVARAASEKITLLQTVNGTVAFGLDLGDPNAKIPAGTYVVHNGIDYIESNTVLPQMQGHGYLAGWGWKDGKAAPEGGDKPSRKAGAGFYTTEALDALFQGQPRDNAEVNMYVCDFD